MGSARLLEILCQTEALKPFLEVLPLFFTVLSYVTIESISSALYLVLTRVFGVIIAGALGVEGVLLLVEAAGPFLVGAIVLLCRVVGYVLK